MKCKFTWHESNQLQDWIISKKANHTNLEECIVWVEEKLKREDLEDIEITHAFQTSDIN